MLTDAQYKALKSWPEPGGYVLGFSRATCEALVFKRCMKRVPFSWFYKKVSPACDEAIREYEEAQERRSKA